MKNFIKKTAFLFKLSLNNIFISKLRALVLFFITMIIVILFFIVFSLSTFLNGYFEAYFKNERGNSDIYLTIDENYGSRYFSIRDLEENLNPDHYETTISYFKVASLSYINESYLYVDIIMSNLNEFKRTGCFSDYDFSLLEQGEILITKSFAKSNNLKIGDSLYLQIGSEKTLFEIAGVLKDDGLFLGSTVFIDKTANIKEIITAIYPDLSSLNPLFFSKLCNVAYVYSNNNIDNQELINEIKMINPYKDLKINESINQDEIKVFVNRNMAYFSVGIALVIISILFVVYSSLIVIFNDRLKQLGILKTLGGSEKEFLIILIFEILFYLISAFLIGIPLFVIIMRFGLNYVSSNYVFTINFLYVFYTFLLLVFLYGFTILFSYLKVKRLAINKVIKTNNFTNSSLILEVIIISFSLFLFIISNIFFNNIEMLKYKGLISYVLIIIIGILLSKILIHVSFFVFKKNKLFNIIFIDDLKRNKITKSIMIVLLVAFTSIVIFIGIARHDERRIEKLYFETKLDLAITNIIKEDDLELYLSNNRKVDSFGKGLLYNNIIINDSIPFSQMISTQNINQYFNFEMDEILIEKMNNSNNGMILMSNEFKYLYKFNIGDQLTLTFNDDYSNEVFEIAGFIETEYNNAVFTNLYLLEGYEVFKYNTIFINTEDKTNLKGELIEKYANNLYYIIDFEELIDELDIYSSNLRRLLSFISLFFVFCFVFTILNNSILLFESNKKTFAKLQLLGCSKKQLGKNIVYQYFLMAFIAIICSLLAVYIIINNMKYILLLFNVYQAVHFNILDYLIGYVVCVSVFLVSYLYYLKLVIKAELSTSIKEVE